MSFSQALSGLNAQQQKLGAAGNNIANSQTVGFKSSNVQFADVFAESRIGLGTRVAATVQDFSQGNIESSNRNMDLAIAGEGFFRFEKPSGEIGYSRNGQLTMQPNGDLVNAQGARLMGYAADEAGNVQAGGDVEALRVASGDLEANATTELDLSLNLDSGVEALDVGDFDSTDASTYNFSTNATIFDSQGNARNLSAYFIKDANATNQWAVRGRISGGPESAETYEGLELGTLEFNQDGTLATDNSADIEITNQGEFGNGDPFPFENLSIEPSFDGSTQFANTSTVNDISQNGYSSGSLVGVTFQQDGTIQRNYSNEQSLAAGQVALVSFRNEEGLKPEGDNLWAETGDSGEALIGAPGTGQRGLIEPSAVETSNVQLAEQLVDTIISQRAYQANSQTISTQDELLQTIINL